MKRINEEPQIHDDPVENRDNDSEEEEDEDDQYEYGDGFLVDSADDGEEEEEEQRQCSSKQSRNRRKKDDDFSLHEDDYQLLQDNNVNFQKNKYKRLKKSSVEEKEIDESGIGTSTEHKISETLFDDDDDDDDLSHFIVDEDGHGAHGTKKKRKFRQGTDLNAMQYANELFGDSEELLKLRKKDLAYNERRERKLEDEFEPIVLSENYMTEKDDEIRKLDVPERIQIFEEAIGIVPVDEISIEEESNWIYARLVHEQVQGCLVNKDDIVKFLELYHVQKLEIPFIAMYRKEQCRSLFFGCSDDDGDFNLEKKLETKWHKVLWMIQDLDRKWLLLRKRKIALFDYYTKRFEEETCKFDQSKNVFESVIKSLKAAETEREVDDVDSKFNLHFPHGEIDEGQYKRPNRKSQYSICSKFGIREFANKFGYSGEQLGLALSLEKVLVDELQDAKETPEEMALNYVCAFFEDPQAVLRGARHVAAVEISCEPSIRKYVRGIYMENAVVSTSPTPDGNVVIDSFHRFSAVKWLREKPLRRFDESAQWLLIQKAEEEKLLQVTFKLPENQMNMLISEFSEHYVSVGVSKYAQLWNEQRKLIVEDAIHGFILPSMEKEARSLLTSRAKTQLLSEYRQVLWNKVSSGPYRKEINSLDEEASPRVLVCCWGPGNPETTFVMLDSSGELLDVLYAGSIALRSRDVNDQKRKRKDQDRLLKFIRDHKPDVVALGAVNLSCLRLKSEIYEVIFQFVEEMVPRKDKMYDLTIVLADESLPRLYENSRISSEQLPQQSGIVKRAVALGRYLQNPLAMIATLCGPGKEILSWKLHSLQNFLDPEEKYEMVEQVMVDITNQVGIDINLAASHKWLFAPLQFVSGLGPRKAASLQRSLVRAGSIFVRKELINHRLGKKVFVNAAGFLRICRSGLASSSNQCIDLLDYSRIHPESYSLAQELAKDVYAHERADEDDAIEHVRDQPVSLRKVVLDEYLRSKNQENKKETYGLILRELSCGFQDWRSLYKEVDPDEEFYMISGETEETISVGRIVQATVQRVTSGKAMCVLDSGLPGILMKTDYSDDGRDIVDLSNKLCEGDIVTCKIKSIATQRFLVFLVCKESEMRNNRNLGVVDGYYHEEDRNSAVIVKEKAPKEKKQFKSRMIVHPRFQNITAEQATEYLSDKSIGESIVRPSSRGLKYLTLMIKFFDNVYANKEIIEGEKENKDIVSLQRIGKTLKIGNETFEDLDEVMDQYVDPLVAHLMTMFNYRKFETGTKSEIDDLLRVEKVENPKMVVYRFVVSHEHPGSFILSYIRSANPHHEYIGLYPKGFKFRNRMFGDLDRLVAYFKRHIDDGPVHY